MDTVARRTPHTWIARVLSLVAALAVGGAFAGPLHGPPPPAAGPGRDAPSDDFPAVPAIQIAAAHLSRSAVLPAPDILQAVLESSQRQFAPHESPWLAMERKTFAHVLAGNRVQTLVVPAQVQGFGTDRISRSLFTAELAYSLAEHGVPVADPYLVMRALGDGQRTISRAFSDELAQQLGATQVIETFIGHDRHGHLSVLARVYDKRRASDSILSLTPKAFGWTDLTYSDEAGGALVPSSVVTDLLSRLGVGAVPSHDAMPLPAARAKLRIPKDPGALLTDGTPDSTAPLRFALLGELVPHDTDRARERLFEKVLLALERTTLPESQGRFLRSFALFKLSRRPAALAGLGDLQDPASRALREILNGNLPGTDSLVAKVNGVERILLDVELHDLQFRYKSPDAERPDKPLLAFAARGPIWAALLVRRLVDLNGWEAPSNVALKQALDHLYPVAGYSTADALAQAHTTSNSEQAAELTPDEHIRRLLATTAATWAKRPTLLTPSPWDVIDLIQADAEAELIRATHALLFIQGRPKDALDYLDTLAVRYDGHPEFAALRSLANEQLAKSVPADRRAAYDRAALEAVLDAIVWAQGQMPDLIEAVSGLGIESATYETRWDLLAAYSCDVPLRDYWFAETNTFWGTDNARRARLRDQLRYAQTSTSAIFALTFDGQGYDRALAQRELASRFRGNPDAFSLRPENAAPKDDSALLATLRAHVRAEPENWSHYVALSNALVLQDGDYAAAADVLAKFPLFAPARRYPDTVELSNDAYEEASPFYWRGEIEASRRLNEIAARYENGSDASLAAAERLRIVRGDLRGAMQYAHERIDRYQDLYAYQDYISMAHALGEHREASALFDANALNPGSPAAWHGALVGERITALEDRELLAWIEAHTGHTDSALAHRYGALFAMLWYTTDRMPPPDLTQIIRSLTHDPVGRATSGQLAIYPSLDTPGMGALVNPSNFRRSTRPALPEDQPVDSDLTLFAQAYLALRRGDFSGSVRDFDQLAGRYTMESDIIGGSALYALPYFAYASSKSGDSLGLEKFLDSLPVPQYGFDAWLAKAFFQAARGEQDAALASLRSAYNRMPYTGDRPVFIDYQFVEGCDWVFESTHDPRVRAFALDFARRYQKVDPTRAWPYAYVAQHSADPVERQHALDKAIFLDGNSVRLKGISAPDLASARLRLRAANPFVPRAAKSPMDSLISAIASRQ